MASPLIDSLIQQCSRLPGLGPRSARRMVLHLLRARDTQMLALADKLREVATAVQSCLSCGNLDTQSPCHICADERRDKSLLCVVEELPDLWALERSGMFRGRYHVLGGTLSALHGTGPDELRIPALVQRVADGEIQEIILATNATVAGQTTAHYIVEQLDGMNVKITQLAQGIPVGAELDYLDDGTLFTAFQSRKGI